MLLVQSNAFAELAAMDRTGGARNFLLLRYSGGGSSTILLLRHLLVGFASANSDYLSLILQWADLVFLPALITLY